MIIFSSFKLSACAHKARRFFSSSSATDRSESLVHLLEISTQSQSLKLIRQAHARIHHLSLAQNSLLATKLISGYSACKSPVDSLLCFDSVQVKDIYAWNNIISACVRNHLFQQSFQLLKQMLDERVILPDEFTFSSLAKVCGEFRDVFSGRVIHGICLKNSLYMDSVLGCSLMTMYSKVGCFLDGLKLFDEVPERNITSWNAMLSGYLASKNCSAHDIWSFVNRMQVEGLRLNAFTVSSLLAMGRGNDKRLYYGRELHCYSVINGLEMNLSMDSNLHLGSCLIDMYAKCDRIDVAKNVFDTLNCRNVYVWTALINGYVHNAAFDEAFILFRQMQSWEGIEPNSTTIVSILPACGSSARLMTGKEIHGFTIRRELDYEASLCNALIDMYCKCGSLSSARQVFGYCCFTKDSITWSSMISGCALHGKAQDAVVLYDEMLQNGIRPDTITIVVILSACGRAGLVDEGLRIYNSAINDHGLDPTAEMCACVVDMLGRYGLLDQAFSFIKAMPFQPGPSIWGALVNASVLHRNKEIQDLAYKYLMQIEPENPSNYVSISNSYASSEKWDGVAELRSLMKTKGFRKLPGCSWISINNETHSFYVADKLHPCRATIHKMLDELLLAMKGPSNDPEFELLTQMFE